ncbi:hypothetical protein [Paenibacillus silvisoli]|uniref:hypothetical protein n=1 Tax=Paenibacillus silvisoli TaxID=3110539 RepID=UPI002803B3D1|nr:hypothetical protein [Paenibacillus silvisoli]
MIDDFELREFAKRIQIGQKKTFFGFTDWGRFYQHLVIPTKVEIVKRWIWDKRLIEIESLRIEVEHPNDNEAVKRNRPLPFDTKDNLPSVYRIDIKQKGGFMIFEGWHPMTRINTLLNRMYANTLKYNKDMNVKNFLRHISAFHPKCLESAKKYIGAEPIVYFMVDRGWLDISRHDERMNLYHNRKKLHPVWRYEAPSPMTKAEKKKAEIKIYSCKHGCHYQAKHRGAMNLHEYVHCKMKT